jgi:hypothetical protein
MPDFSSSGLWRECCGVEFSNPKEELCWLPDGLVSAIELWVSYWDMACIITDVSSILQKNYTKEMFIKTGRFLQGEISKYYDCILSDNLEFYFYKDE